MALNVLFSSLRAPRRFFVLCALCAPAYVTVGTPASVSTSAGKSAGKSVASFSLEAQPSLRSPEANSGWQARIESQFRIARLKYSGGGDWYNDPSAEVNLLRFVGEQTNIDVDPRYEFVELSSEKLFSYPMLFMTGHGNVVFSEYEAQRLRIYLTNGGFLYIDDDYGMDKALRRELKKVFPDHDLAELPFTHGLYSSHFNFPNGVPKTHEHDGKPAQGFGLFLKGRLMVYYTYESNPSDGWADPEIHNNPEATRQEALRFGTNIVVWALSR